MTLPNAINTGDPGHALDHEEIAALLGLVDGQDAFRVTGVGFLDDEGFRPSATTGAGLLLLGELEDLDMQLIQDWTAFPTMQNGFTTGGALGPAEYRILRPPDSVLPGGGAVLEDWMFWRGGLITPDPKPGSNTAVCSAFTEDPVYWVWARANLEPAPGYGGVGVRAQLELKGTSGTLQWYTSGGDIANEETDLSYYGPWRIVRT